MEKRGRKKEDKIRIIIALNPDLIQKIKGYAKQSGKNVSVFMEEVLALKGKCEYTMPRWDRHERKKMCLRLPQATIDYIKATTVKDKVTQECLIDAKLKLYEMSPQLMLEKTFPFAVEYVTTGEGKDKFFNAFQDMCVSYGTENRNTQESKKDYRTIVGQKLAIRCIRSLTDSQLLRLDKVLEEFCEMEWKSD